MDGLYMFINVFNGKSMDQWIKKPTSSGYEIAYIMVIPFQFILNTSPETTVDVGDFHIIGTTMGAFKS